MVEIVLPPYIAPRDFSFRDNTNRCYEIRTAVTPNRASNTGAVLRDFKSLCN